MEEGRASKVQTMLVCPTLAGADASPSERARRAAPLGFSVLLLGYADEVVIVTGCRHDNFNADQYDNNPL